MKKSLLKIVGSFLLTILLIGKAYAVPTVTVTKNWYVDYSAGSDTNSGDSASVTATGTKGVCAGGTTFTDADGGFTGTTGRYIYIQFGTPALYKIASVTSDTEVELTAAGPNESSITWTIGGAWKTVEFASTEAILDGDTRVNFKNTATYVLLNSATITINPSEDALLIFQGYSSTIGDGGIATFDGNDGVTNATSIFDLNSNDNMTFMDLIMQDADGDGVDINNSAADDVVFFNVKIHNHGDDGVYSAQSGTGGLEFYFSEISGANGDCIQLYNGCSLYYSYVHDASNIGISSNRGANMFFSIIDTTGSYNLTNTSGGQDGVIINNTFYNAQTNDNIGFTNNADEHWTFINNIVDTAADKNFEQDSGSTGLMMLNNNLRGNGGTASNANVLILANETNSSPGFTNAANGDFTIDTTLKAVGFPTSNYYGTSTRSYNDVGALQREEAGSGGGAFSFGFAQ